MDSRVERHWMEHHVRHIDYFLNGLLTIVGVTMIAFAAARILLTQSSYGWTSQLLPLYALYGGVGALGFGLTAVSIKWMVGSCKQSIEFDRHSEL